MKHSVFTLGVALCLTASGPAAAQPKPTKDECLDAFEAAQRLDRDGKLRDARERFELCANEACPALVKNDCEPRARALATEIPSVRVNARGTGDVTVDGNALPAPAADGTIELDPGEHVFEQAGSRARIVLDKGQRGVEPAPAETRPIPAAVWVLGGVAVVGLAGFVGFGLSGRSQQSDLDDCKPNCSQGDVDDMKRSYLLADIALGIAAVAGGAAAYLYFTDKKGAEPEGGAFVSVGPTPHGAALSAGMSF